MRILCVDPGEDTGWAIFDDDEFIDADTSKLWEFGEAVYAALHDDPMTLELTGDWLAQKFVGIEAIVCEDFRIYPWEAKKGTLNWDQVRTARLIGALTLLAKVKLGKSIVLQPAAIKERAEAAGAEHYFMSPLHENRHANDAIRHGVYYNAIQRGTANPVQVEGEPQDD